MIEYLEYLFSVLCEDGMSARSFFRTAAGVRKNLRPIGMFYLPLFLKGPLFFASGFCAHVFSSPLIPPKNSRKQGIKNKKMKSIVSIPHPTYMVSHFPCTPVSIPSLPVWVWLCVCGLWENVCEDGTTSIPGFFRVNYGPAGTNPWDEYSPRLGEGIGRQGLNKT